jgi:AGZA family xanthine/uracil permease-like MFS transporter
MAYILAVNPNMLGEIGNGMTAGAVFTATAISAAIATLAMAFAANLPVALAPGMGLNAFFTYTVVFGMGYSWQTALTAVFLEGVLFIILSFFNVREAIVKAMPACLKKAVAVGIGFFITLIGLANAGVVVNSAGSIVGLGDLSAAAPMLAVIGLAITIALYALKAPGAILIGILATAAIGIPLGVTVVPPGWLPIGSPEAPLFFRFDFSSVLSFKFLTVLFTFLFVDIFDTVGTLVGVATQAGLTDKKGNIPRAKQALLADAVGTVAGSALGTSTVTSYVESTAGIAAGGRTGLTALSTGVLFLVALLLSPIFLLIPSAATAPALVLVGFLMMKPIASIDFTDPTEGIPVFLTLVMMPFAYSIAEGIVCGMLSFVFLKVVTRKWGDVTPVAWILFIIFALRILINFCIN